MLPYKWVELQNLIGRELLESDPMADKVMKVLSGQTDFNLYL